MTRQIDWSLELASLTPTYLLVDPMLGEPFPELSFTESANAQTLLNSRTQCWQRATHLVPLNRKIDLHLHQHPYLVAMNGPEDPLLEFSYEQAMQEWSEATSGGLAGSGRAIHRIGGWIQSSQTPQELCDQLARLLCVNTRAPTTARYLRLADRRALDCLLTTVGDARLSAAMGRIASWLYLDGLGNLIRIQNNDTPHSTLALGVDEWQRFINGSKLHPVVAMWVGEMNLQKRAIESDSTTIYVQAQRGIERAQQAASKRPELFRTTKDIEHWAVLEMLSPNEIEVPANLEPGETIEVISQTMLTAIREKKKS